MPRIERATEYYVRVNPRMLGECGVSCLPDYMVESDEAKRLEMYRETCEAMVDQIKRHVDEVGTVTVEREAEFVCGYCDRPWTEDADSPHNGGCCVTDCKVYEAPK